jgi:hypothetical protein
VLLVGMPVEVRVQLAHIAPGLAGLLGELAGQLNDGRVHDRDRAILAPVLETYRRLAHSTGAHPVTR